MGGRAIRGLNALPTPWWCLITPLDLELARPLLFVAASIGRNARPPISTPGEAAATAPRIIAAIEHGLSNARVEAINTQIRLITRCAFSFTPPRPSSSSPCSPSPASAHHYQDDSHDPPKRLETRFNPTQHHPARAVSGSD